MSEPNILGYVVCHTCNEPKAIKQGTGKRKAFVHGRCSCGPDTRTGAAAQAELSAYRPLDAVEAELLALNAVPEPITEPNQTESDTQSEPKPETKPETKPNPIEGEFIPNDETQSKPLGAVTCAGIGALLGLVLGGAIKVVRSAV